MRREGSHAACRRQRPFGFDARTCTRTLALIYAHTHAQAHSHTRSHACTRSYYLPVVSDTPQRIPTVLCAHAAAAGYTERKHAVPSASSPLSEWRTPAFRSWAPSTSPAALHRHLRPLCTQRTRRGSLRAGLVYLNAPHLPQASPCQSLLCIGVRALRGRNDIARLVGRSTRTQARVCACTAVCQTG